MRLYNCHTKILCTKSASDTFLLQIIMTICNVHSKKLWNANTPTFFTSHRQLTFVGHTVLTFLQCRVLRIQVYWKNILQGVNFVFCSFEADHYIYYISKYLECLKKIKHRNKSKPKTPVLMCDLFPKDRFVNKTRFIPGSSRVFIHHSISKTPDKIFQT